MPDDQLPDNMRYWDEGDTPYLAVTLVDSSQVAVPLANILTLTITQWLRQPRGLPGITINSRKGQNALNANNVTVGATSGRIVWNLQTGDTAMQSLDIQQFEERHDFRFDVTYNASGLVIAKSYPDYYVVRRKQATR